LMPWFYARIRLKGAVQNMIFAVKIITLHYRPSPSVEDFDELPHMNWNYTTDILSWASKNSFNEQEMAKLPVQATFLRSIHFVAISCNVNTIDENPNN
jgi:hypothetical protein